MFNGMYVNEYNPSRHWHMFKIININNYVSCVVSLKEKSDIRVYRIWSKYIIVIIYRYIKYVTWVIFFVILYLLFYVNDLNRSTDSISMIRYGDDINPFCSGPDLTSITDTDRRLLKKSRIMYWYRFKANIRALNVKKTCSAMFSILVVSTSI